MSWKRRSNLLVALFLLALLSCKKSEDMYLETQDNNAKDVTVTDTITLELTTVRDRAVVNNLYPDMLGTYMDPVFGRTTAEVYSQVRLASTAQPSFDDQPVLDSFVLTLEYVPDEQRVGDPTRQQTWRVYELDQSLQSNTNYFSDTTIDIIPTPIGETTARVNLGDSTLRIRLEANDNYFAKKFFNADPKSFNDASSFASFLKGIAIIPDSTGLSAGEGALLPFSVGSQRSSLILYYHTASQNGLTFPMNMTPGAVRLNLATHNYNGTPVGQQLSNPGANYGRAYLQGLGGLRIKVDIPYLKELTKDNAIAVHRADFIFPKIDSSADPENNNVPTQVVLYPRDKDGNTVLDNFFDPNFEYYGGEWNGTERTYSVTLTLWMQTLLNGYHKNLDFTDYGLNLRIPPDGGAGRAILTTQYNTAHPKPKLVLTYSKIADK